MKLIMPVLFEASEGATGLTFALPYLPKKLNMHIPEQKIIGVLS